MGRDGEPVLSKVCLDTPFLAMLNHQIWNRSQKLPTVDHAWTAPPVVQRVSNALILGIRVVHLHIKRG